MLVDVIQLYLLCITIHPNFFGYILFVRWFTSYPKPVPPQIARIGLLRYALWLLVAGVGWLLLVTHSLYWGVPFVTVALDLGVYYLTLTVAKRAAQPGSK